MPSTSTTVVPESSTRFIDCEDVHKSFGSFKALNGVSTKINAGEIVCILGPSGGGKSTFLRVLNALESIDRGSIVIDGKTLPGKREVIESVRREVGMVFQQFNLFSHMSIRDNVSYAPIKARKMKKSAAYELTEQLLKRVGIEEQINKFPNQLSGGQQQRVAIARALAMEPKAMLFDEPTSALDPEMVRDVLDVVRELAQSGMTMLIVTHEMGFAREVSNRMMFMAQGQLLVDTSPDEFFDSPSHDQLIRFLSKIV